LFEDEDGDNVLQCLTLNQSVNEMDTDNHQHVDDTFHNVMIQLRQMGYLKKEDIQKYDLVSLLCSHRVIPGKRFRFLVEWDPTSLIQSEEYSGRLPLYFATSNIQEFRMVFEYGVGYYPKRKGISLLFKKNSSNTAPCQLACIKTF
jgi:hypothetical protein